MSAPCSGDATDECRVLWARNKADLALMVESATSSELAQVWNDLMARWVRQPSVPDPAQLDLFLARLASDGLWLFEATRPAPLAPEVKKALLRRIAALTEARPDPPLPAPARPISTRKP